MSVNIVFSILFDYVHVKSIFDVLNSIYRWFLNIYNCIRNVSREAHGIYTKKNVVVLSRSPKN